MMTYPRAWKIVFILFLGLDTSRMLFLVLIEVNLWDVNLAAEQTPLKYSGHVSGHWFLRVKGSGLSYSSVLYASSLATTVMSYDCNQSYIPYNHLAQEEEDLGHEWLVL